MPTQQPAARPRSPLKRARPTARLGSNLIPMGALEFERVPPTDTGNAPAARTTPEHPAAEPAPPPDPSTPLPRPPTADPLIRFLANAAPVAALVAVLALLATSSAVPSLRAPAAWLIVALLVWLVAMVIPATRSLAAIPIHLIAAPLMFRSLRLMPAAELTPLSQWPGDLPTEVRQHLQRREREFEQHGFRRGALFRVIAAHLAGRPGVCSGVCLCLENPQTRHLATMAYTLTDPLSPPSATRLLLRHIAPDGSSIGVTNEPGARTMRRRRTDHFYALPPDASVQEMAGLHAALLREHAPGSRHPTVAERGGWSTVIRTDDARARQPYIDRGMYAREAPNLLRLATPLWITAGWRHIPAVKALRARLDVQKTRAFQRRRGLQISPPTDTRP